jgi:PKD repeat protein
VPLTVTFTWTGGDPDPGDTVVYDFYLGITNAPGQFASGLDTESYTTTLTEDTTYYWKVEATDGIDVTVGPIWSLTTGPDTDGDGLINDNDNCPTISNPNQENYDNDAYGDICDADDDQDGIIEPHDNCRLTPNHYQEDWNTNDIGDACDDSDLDGIVDQIDTCYAVPNPNQADADGDGAGDACEDDIDNDGELNGVDTDDDGDLILDGNDNCPTVYDESNNAALCADTDNDGIFDTIDNCDNTPNPDQKDFDGDGAGDACDLDDDNDGTEDTQETDNDDDDGDGRIDSLDNCPLTPNNPEWADVNNDGIGDACADFDADGIFDSDDNCIIYFNPGQEDLNENDIGDACDGNDDGDWYFDWDDNCPLIVNNYQEDGDEDGVGDECDNCPTIWNNDQANYDADAYGDWCDANDDQDAYFDSVDNCPKTPNVFEDNWNDNETGDACEDYDGDGVFDIIDNCVLAPNPFQENQDGDLFGDVCDTDADGDGVTDDPVTEPDTDGDGIIDTDDNCDNTPNPDQKNYDGDALGDACDLDDDGDGIDDADDTDNDNDLVKDEDDNCPMNKNPFQKDINKDGIGDVCSDFDADGVVDWIDNCIIYFNPGQENTDDIYGYGDAYGDVCDSDDDQDGIADWYDRCPRTASGDQTDSNYDYVGDVCTLYTCVSSSSGLVNALSAAETNGMLDIIAIEKGTYQTDPGFRYSSSEQYGLYLVGGYTPDCADRELDPENTVIIGNSAGDLDINASGNSSYGVRFVGSIILDGLTLAGANKVSLTADSDIIVANSLIKNKGEALSINVDRFSDVILLNNIITGNSDTDNPLVHVYDFDDITLTNNTVAGNSSGTDIPVMRLHSSNVFSSGAIDLYNNIIWGNTGDKDVKFEGAEEPMLYNNIYNTTAMIFDETPLLIDNLPDEDPLFEDEANGDFHLLLNSPAINAGFTNAPESASTDHEGQPRNMGGAVDIGALERNPVNASFTASPLLGIAPLNVRFINTSTSETAGAIINSLSWDLDSDGTVDYTDQDPYVSYQGAGLYSVTLTVTDTSGDSDTDTVSDYIEVLPNTAPVAIINGPHINVAPGEEITFNDDGSYDPDYPLGWIVDYEWDFGDGEIVNGPALTLVPHTYNSSSIYNATLTVTDDKGATDEATWTVNINAPPVADAGPDMSTIPDADITFNGYGSTDSDGTIESYQWNLGDGTIITGASVTHSYASDLTYDVTLTVTDDDGAESQDTAQVTVMTAENFNIYLTGMWDAMKAALSNGQIDTAVSHFASDSQSVYRDQFTSLESASASVLSAIADEMNSAEIYLVELDEDYAKYEILLTRNGRALSFHLMFVRDTDGIWRIWRF